MRPQTFQAVADCLLRQKSTLPAVRFARTVCAAMLGTPAPWRWLKPVFTRMNGNHPGWYLTGDIQDGKLHMPTGECPDLPDRSVLLGQLDQVLRSWEREEDSLESMLDTLEQYGSRIPAAEDISEFDLRKMTAAIAGCAAEYAGKLTEDAPVFLLYTADFSGVQKFIYTVSTSNALKSLRSRSFFLELAMEHFIDELLTACGMSRVNLLYSGGGHCYLLLPNTEHVRETVDAWSRKFNDWLCRHFGTNLYLADGCTCASANDLTNTPAEEAPYQAMFRRVSSSVGRRKVTRYTPDQIRALNRQDPSSGQRECRICGTRSHLKEDIEGNTVCLWCSLFETLSPKILQSDTFLVVNRPDGDFTLPGFGSDVSFLFCSREEAGRVPRDQILRVYCKNRAPGALPHSIRLFVGDYTAQSKLSLLVQSSQGVSRLGVCRMDVDNLGQAFVSGFEQATDNPHKRSQYVNLIRTSAFSRQLSLFFKRYVNQLLSGEFENQRPLAVTIVYSGGDDVFIVGSWTDTIEAALRIRNGFRRYSCASLTLSAGISLFEHHHPIRYAAIQTAELEDEAKSLPGKDGISLFAANQGHVYSWDDYEHLVCGEKLALLLRFFEDENTSRGLSFLYNIVNLLREANQYAGKGIPLARLAHLLARMSPAANSPSWQIYEHFSKKVYEWALDPIQRRQLITAIYLYVYQKKGA